MLVMEIHGKKPRGGRSRPSNLFTLPEGLIGLEYEFEKVGQPKWDSTQGVELAKYFSAHADGSLRDNGIEFVLREPLFGEDLHSAIRAMDEMSRAYRYRASYRTSMHVHLDMERASYPDQILSLATLYAIAEPFMYKFVGQARDCCNYCLPWFRHDQHFNLFLNGVKMTLGNDGPHVIHKMQSLKEWKYSGLNFFSIGDYGTLEFRHAPVGMEASRVIDWINIIQSLKKYATRSNMTYQKLLEKAVSKPYHEFLGEVFESHFRTLIKFAPRPEESYHLGLKTASSFAASAAMLNF